MKRQAAAIEAAPDSGEFLADAVAGLSAFPRTLPCKYFYDETGSQLFDGICELDEYYLTRTETSILEEHGSTMTERIGPGAALIEYGSGSSVKTCLLLDRLRLPAAYVPIDISREHLLTTVVGLRERYPDLRILPVVADYTADFDLPPAMPEARRTAFFPGSTLGNFAPPEARAFLRRIARRVRPGGGLLIGVDLKKDPAELEAAYNDASGVTREFNLNLLARMNRELDADFDLAAFEHRAIWNEEAGRVEMHLESRRDQRVRLGEQVFRFAKGETIWTESSYKFTVEGFARLASEAGFDVLSVWTDPAHRFSVQYLETRPPA